MRKRQVDRIISGSMDYPPESWPTPDRPSREPLPRLEDLPLSERGYEPESVRAAFDSFYRHAAQLDAALRTLEAVDSFQHQAAALRADLRTLRAAGWSQQSWAAPAYGSEMRAPREGIPPALWRILGEIALLVAVAVGVGVAKLSWWVIVLAMAGAFFSLLLGLSWGDVSLIAPASASLTFVGNAAAARFFLHERVDRRRWMAAALVACGVAFLAG